MKDTEVLSLFISISHTKTQFIEEREEWCEMFFSDLNGSQQLFLFYILHYTFCYKNCKLMKSIPEVQAHPSIFHTRLFLFRVMGICWSQSQLLSHARVHPRQVASLSQPGHIQTNNHSHKLLKSSMGFNLEPPINLTYIFLDCGRKPEHLESMQTPHSKAPAGF